MVRKSRDLNKPEPAHEAPAESKMGEVSILSRANVFESGLCSWGIPQRIADELIKHHTKANYEAGRLVFSKGSPADIVMWVVKGVVREICPNPNGTQTLVRVATCGDILGLADRLNDKGDWVRRFEAWTASKCILAMVTRDNLRNLLKGMAPEELLALTERMNSAASEWIEHYATFLGLSYRERVEIVLAELARKFGVPDKDGVLIAFEPTHSDLSEMIGSSRPVIGRVMTELIEDGEVARRDRKYILLHSGSIRARLNGNSRAALEIGSLIQPAASNGHTIPIRHQHKWAR
jgi:CRP/FNR family transcriptional regulator, cyclic AMP receptor protein